MYFGDISIYGIGKLQGIGLCNNNNTCVVCKKNWINQNGHGFGRSFIYNIKNNGPRIEPWGTPYLISYH
jgi:hypothetical protein